MKTLLLASLLLLVGCGEKYQSQEAVKKILKDPHSVKFSQFTAVNDRHYCLEFNAKGGFGGYTGRQQATIFVTDSGWYVIGIRKEAHETCVEIARKL